MVHITDPNDDLREAFDAMEGEGWFDSDAWCYSRNPAHTVGEALDKFVEFGDLDGNPKQQIHYGCIYGIGGRHRYYLMKNGDVVFSSHHGGTKIDKAKTAGFRVS